MTFDQLEQILKRVLDPGNLVCVYCDKSVDEVWWRYSMETMCWEVRVECHGDYDWGWLTEMALMELGSQSIIAAKPFFIKRLEGADDT